MSDTVIKVKNLSKSYQIRHQTGERYTALRDVLANGVKGMGNRLLGRNHSALRTPNSALEEFWALDDVSFEVKQGERVGIIGRNGAGKSTLLKILSRITEPTKGRVHIKGRVASLLEVGTGFHPELTGRENIYLNGAILGMSREEIRRKFDEIVAFAEVEKFLDTPVKRYSSGMYVRLAFAVAAHLEPEILVVDEVLAVGDAEFQRKCLGKMEEVAQTEGRSILFVSHNISAIQRLCQTGVYLRSGQIKKVGGIISVVDAYQKEISRTLPDEERNQSNNRSSAQFVKWSVINPSTKLEHSCYSRDICQLLFTFISKRPIADAYIGFALWDLSGQLVIAGTSRDNNGAYQTFEKGTNQVLVQVRLPLKAGIYQIDVSLNSLDLGLIDLWNADPKLNVLPYLNTNLPETWHGVVNEEMIFKLSHSSECHI